MKESDSETAIERQKEKSCRGERIVSHQYVRLQPLQRAAHPGAEHNVKNLFVNSSRLADPRLIFPCRRRMFYREMFNLCLTKPSILRVSHGCCSCCGSSTVAYYLSPEVFNILNVLFS